MKPIKQRLSFALLMMLFSFSILAQSERKIIREGVKAYEEGDFSKAEVDFRKAADINQESFEAGFNTGAAMYEQKKYEETVRQYESLVDQSEDPQIAAKVWHNIGNSLFEAQQYEHSIEAYKNSLRNNPNDPDTKYNLAYAKQKLTEQQQQQNQDQNQDQQNQDQNKDQQNQDQNQDQQNQDQNKDQQNQDQNKDQQNQDQNKEQQNQDQNKEPQTRPQEISQEDAERMLNAIQQQENDVKEKVDQKKAAVAKVKTEKDW